MRSDLETFIIYKSKLQKSCLILHAFIFNILSNVNITLLNRLEYSKHIFSFWVFCIHNNLFELNLEFCQSSWMIDSNFFKLLSMFLLVQYSTLSSPSKRPTFSQIHEVIDNDDFYFFPKFPNFFTESETGWLSDYYYDIVLK